VKKFLVVQRAKRPYLRSTFTVFEAESKAQALRMFEAQEYHIARDAVSAKHFFRPQAEELLMGKEYAL
jgi:hypothetical protein